MDDVFQLHFGPQGPIPLREPLFHEVEFFYKEVKQSDAHTAMGRLIEKISGAPAEKVDALALTTLRRAQAYLLHFINHEPDVPTGPSLRINLDSPVTSFNQQEAWEYVELHEPTFIQFKGYNERLQPGDSYAALVWLMSELSGVNAIALKKMPITRFREAEKYLAGFLNFFPDANDGKTK